MYLGPLEIVGIFYPSVWKSMAAHRTACRKVMKFGQLARWIELEPKFHSCLC